MRQCVLWPCVVTVLICLVIIHAARLRRADHGLAKAVPSLMVMKAAALPGNEHQAGPVFAASEEVPEWEVHFWEIASEPAWLQSQEELEELAQGMSDDQMRQALEKLAAERSDAGMVLARALIKRWAEKAPIEAAGWAARLPDTDFSHMIFNAVVVPWAESNLDDVTAWVQTLPENGNKTAATWSLAQVAATQEKGATAVALLTEFPAGPERDNWLNYSVRQWATADQDAAVSWIGEVQDPALQERMLDDLAVDQGRQDPAAAAQFAATMLPPGEGQDNAVVNIVRFWAASAPDQAAAWVGQFPDGNLRASAVANLTEIWSKDDPAAAQAWAGIRSE